MRITPMRTVLDAVDGFFSKEQLTGAIALCSGDRVTLLDAPEFADEEVKDNFQRFWNLGFA